MKAIASRVLASLMVLFAVAACAGPASGPEAARVMGPCLPLAVSAQFFFWPVADLRTTKVRTEDGELAEARWALYRRGHAAVAALWVHSDLVAVDPELDTDSPEWIDLSLVMVIKGELVLRRQPEAACRWERWIRSEVMDRQRPEVPALEALPQEKVPTSPRAARLEPAFNTKEEYMSRVSVLEKSQLTPEFAKYVERAAVSGQEQATMFQVLGHCPEMFQAYFQFYFPWHTSGSVDPVLKELIRIKIARLNDCFT